MARWICFGRCIGAGGEAGCRRCAANSESPNSGRKPGYDAVRANFDRPDFFENLAGNHEQQRDA
jgi:hypothetical protein